MKIELNQEDFGKLMNALEIIFHTHLDGIENELFAIRMGATPDEFTDSYRYSEAWVDLVDFYKSQIQGPK